MKRSIMVLVLVFFQLGFQLVAQEESVLAPDFSFVHESGEAQHLSNYNGEVVFISFWASWCKPCLVSFQENEPLRRELQSMGVKMLNVSLDRNKSDWDSSLLMYGFLNGDNVYAEDIRNVMNLYDLTFIPAYQIINRKGQMVSFSEDENNDVISEFNTWLDETSSPAK